MTQVTRQHTPGPWYFEPADRGDDSVGIGPTPAYVYADPQDDGNVVPVCTLDVPVRPHGRPLTDEYDEGVEQIGDERANGVLLATAPRLLAALVKLDRMHRGLDAWHEDAAAEAWIEAHRAIVAATSA